MRAKKALMVSKVISLYGNKARVVNNILYWDGEVDCPVCKVDNLFSDDWQPVECDCEVCEAKRELESYNTQRDSVHILIKHTKCLKEI